MSVTPISRASRAPKSLDPVETAIDHRGVRWPLPLLAALGCGRVGFDPVVSPPIVDADPAVVFAGSCTTPALFPVGAAALAQLAATADGVVYGGDFGDLETFRFDNGELVQLARLPIDSVDGLATDRSGGKIIALTALAGTKYTIVDRMLVDSTFRKWRSPTPPGEPYPAATHGIRRARGPRPAVRDECAADPRNCCHRPADA